MAQCPRCKEDMPLLSKICPVCGYVVEGGEGTPTAEEFVNTLEECLYEIKSIPQPSFFKSMGQLSFIMFPVLALYMLIMAMISEAGLFWVLFLIFGIFSIWTVIQKLRGQLGNTPFNNAFKALKNEYEYNERIAKHSFGKSKEVASLLSEISAQISDIEAKRNVASRKNLLIWIIILALCFGAANAGVFAMNKTLGEEGNTENAGDNTQVSVAKWQEAVENFKSSPAKDNEHECNQVAITILPSILAAGEGNAAEDFFTEHCMGKVGDYDCAALIVRYYAEKSDQSAAQAFIEKCTGMRYKSDQKKLQKLLNR